MANDKMLPLGFGAMGLKRVAGSSLCVAAATLAIVGLGLALAPQAQAAISLVDSGSLTQSANAANSVPVSISSSANVLVVDLDWRISAGATNTPTVTYGGTAITPAVVQLATVGSPNVSSAIYYLASNQAGWATGAGTLSVNFNATVTDSAIDPFTLSGVNLGQLPSSSLLNSTAGTDNEASVNPLSLTLGSIPTNSWGVFTTAYRLGTSPLTASITSGNGTLLGTGQTTSQRNNFWYVATANCDYAGAVVQNIQSSSVTFTESAGGLANVHWTMAGAVFTPAVGLTTNYTWTGGTNGNWDLSTSGNWSGSGTVYTDNSAVTFVDGAANPYPITIAAGGVQPQTITFSNSATNYLFQGGPIYGFASVTLNGSGTVTLNNSNSYYGGTTINAGTLVSGNNSALGTALVTVGPAGKLSFISPAFHRRAQRRRQHRAGQCHPRAVYQP